MEISALTLRLWRSIVTSKIIVIGDTHAHPHYDNKRFTAMGEFAAEELSTVDDGVVVQIGDWADCTAFNSHGSKLEMEGARWRDDVHSSKDALARFMAPFYRRKRKLPRRYVTLGNHEQRINRWVAQEPQFEGMLSTDDLGFKEYGFETIPFGTDLVIDGLHFVHHLGSMTGRAAAISSPSNGVRSMGVSYIVGHSHVAGWFPVYYKDRTVQGFDVGCATHKDMGPQEGWSKQTAHKYRRCIWVFENVKDGDFDFRHIRLETLGV